MKVFPVWNGGGTVKIVFVNSDWGVPSSTLVDTVQTAVDPSRNQGEGVGIAPIGHVVTVVGVTGTAISVSFKLTFATGYAWDTVKTAVTKAIQDYFVALAKDWANQSGITVRVSQVTTSSWRPYPNMGVNAGKPSWAFIRLTGTPWKRAANGF